MTLMQKANESIMRTALSFVLPEGMLDYFELKRIEEIDNPKKTDKNYNPFNKVVNFYLDEIDQRNPDQLHLRPNGFTEYTKVTDFPLRKRLCTLYIRRRRYEDDQDKNTIICKYPLKAKGTSVSPEFADFLKGRLR